MREPSNSLHHLSGSRNDSRLRLDAVVSSCRVFFKLEEVRDCAAPGATHGEIRRYEPTAERVISPVIATSLRAGLPDSADTSAVAMVTLAEGSSLGMAPAGTWM